MGGDRKLEPTGAELKAAAALTSRWEAFMDAAGAGIASLVEAPLDPPKKSSAGKTGVRVPHHPLPLCMSKGSTCAEGDTAT